MVDPCSLRLIVICGTIKILTKILQQPEFLTLTLWHPICIQQQQQQQQQQKTSTTTKKQKEKQNKTKVFWLITDRL